MTKISSPQYFNDPQPANMEKAGIVRAGKFNEVVTDIATLFSYRIAALITATNVSTTIDFGALLVGDTVINIPDTAGNALFSVVSTAGTLPQAAVVGDLYIVIRANG